MGLTVYDWMLVGALAVVTLMLIELSPINELLEVKAAEMECVAVLA